MSESLADSQSHPSPVNVCAGREFESLGHAAFSLWARRKS